MDAPADSHAAGVFFVKILLDSSLCDKIVRKRDFFMTNIKNNAGGQYAATENFQNNEYVSLEYEDETEIVKPSLLLHSCCGPCCASAIFGLIYEFDVTVYYYNPNITDRAEYEKRLESQKVFIDKYNSSENRVGKINFIEGPFEPECYFHEIKGLEDEPEGGQRCRECFRFRLEKAAETAKLGGYDCFTTTLSVSPHKSYELISEIGRYICVRYGIGFIDRDLKKIDAYARGFELAKRYALYRQNFCGCEFSRGRK